MNSQRYKHTLFLKNSLVNNLKFFSIFSPIDFFNLFLNTVSPWLWSNSTQWPLVPYFCSWATQEFQFFHKKHMLGTLDFTVSELWAPFNFSQSPTLISPNKCPSAYFNGGHLLEGECQVEGGAEYSPALILLLIPRRELTENHGLEGECHLEKYSIL